jgi:periplasmic copper chaperone A
MRVLFAMQVGQDARRDRTAFMMRLSFPRLFRLRLALLATTVWVAACSPAPEDAGSIVISDAWTRPTAAGMPMGVAYFTITNGTDVDDALIAASTPAAARVEMHETSIEDGMARMRPLTEIHVPAGGRVAVAPGGIHLMLVDLAQPLVAGTRVPLTLEFRTAGKLTVELSVEARGG